jgi:hypothetical protein
MYGRGSISALMTGSATTASGIAVLPNTSGNSMGMLLAYVAIAIGVSILISQLTVRIIRKKYQK